MAHHEDFSDISPQKRNTFGELFDGLVEAQKPQHVPLDLGRIAVEIDDSIDDSVPDASELNPNKVHRGIDELTPLERQQLEEIFASNAPPETWLDRALCSQIDPEIFYPEPGQRYEAALAQQVCRLCEVRPHCLRFAIETDEQFGIWGGLPVRQRRRLKKR